MRVLFGVSTALALLSASPASLAEVITVGPSGADYGQIKAAVLAATDGDTIHVEAGTYQGFRIDDKELRIVNVSGGAVLATGVIRIHDLAPGKTVVLSGIDAAAPEAEGLIVFQSQGHVRVQGGHFHGGDGEGHYGHPEFGRPGAAGAKVVESSDVVFERCNLEGGNGEYGVWNYFIYATEGGHGLLAQDARVTLLSSTAQGRAGGSWDENCSGSDGGDGVHAENSVLFVAGSVLNGGNGGHGGAGDFVDDPGGGGRGGDGLNASSSRAHLLDNVYAGGLRGVGGCCGPYGNGSNGQPGVELQSDAQSTVDELVGVARTLEGPSVATAGAAVSLTIHGNSGDEVFIASSHATNHRLQLAEKGVWLLGDGALQRARSTSTGGLGVLGWPLDGDSLGTVGASGTLVVDRPIGELPPGVAAEALFFQAILVRPNGRAILSDLQGVEVVE